MEPIPSECRVECGQLIQTREYYVTYSKIDTLALLEETKGSNLLCYRTRSQRIRTIAQLEMKVKIPCSENVAIYQVLAPKIRELKILNLSDEEIAIRLDINKKTVKKGLVWPG